MRNLFTRRKCSSPTCEFNELDITDLERDRPACPNCGEALVITDGIYLLNCKCNGGCGVMFQINAASPTEQPTVCPVPTCQSTDVSLMPPDKQIDFSGMTKDEYLAAVAARHTAVMPR